MDKIISARDMAERAGYGNVRERIGDLSIRTNRPWNGEVTEAAPVKARIDFGRWIADCECGGAEYVDPDDPILYCLSCGNKAHGGAARRVILPKNREKIEAVLLERKVESGVQGAAVGLDTNAKLTDGIPRSWDPGESLTTLRLQHQAALARRDKEVSDGV